jgi:hypothetical protein
MLMMSEVIKISTLDVVPDEKSVMLLQGIPLSNKPPENAQELFAAAKDVYRECVQPAGIMKEIQHEEFQDVYKGQSLNAEHSPVPKIAAKANGLALFAVTLGQVVHDKINELFEAKELALGSMLDSAASAGAEKAADMVEIKFLESLRTRSMVGKGTVVMRYSPGYCGWHVSGQRKLFEYLKPEQIGIKLRDSFLMEPLKSVSGVMIAGTIDIHFIHDDYSFCGECETHSCQDRIKMLMGRT